MDVDSESSRKMGPELGMGCSCSTTPLLLASIVGDEAVAVVAVVEAAGPFRLTSEDLNSNLVNTFSILSNPEDNGVRSTP